MKGIIAAILLLVAAVLYSDAHGAQTPQVSSYSLPERINTQSGGVYVDGAGTVFIVARSADRTPNRLVVYVDGRCVLCDQVDAIGAPSGVIGPDGQLYVSVVGSDQRTIYRYRIEGWVRVSFLSRASALPMVNK